MPPSCLGQEPLSVSSRRAALCLLIFPCKDSYAELSLPNQDMW